ncbi:MAG: TonB-dependent receptor [Gemmatimonadota bacterium]
MGKLLYSLILLAVLAVPVQAQSAPGNVVGRIVDASTASPLVGAQVIVEGTDVGALAGLDGRYRVTRVPAGVVALRVQMIGYATKIVTDVTVGSGSTTALDISLESSAVEVEGITVTAAAERGSVAGALNEQRSATAVVNAITSEQISRSPDSDAAAAIKRVSGITVQDDKYVMVRGLGERYTTTSLNGVRLPSPEPERRVVPLDIFPSGLLQSISTAKTFTPDQPGDFAGGQVDIRTQSFPGRPEVTFSASTSLSTTVIGQDVLAVPSVGLDWFASGSADRALSPLAEQWGNFQPAPGQDDVNQIINSFRNVWSPSSVSGRPGGSLGASIGGTAPLLGRELGYLASLTYGASESRKEEHRRAQAIAETGGEAREVDRYEGESGSRSVSIGGLLNATAILNEDHRVLVNGAYNRSADADARQESGFSENLGQGFDIQRLQYVEREMISTQLGGEHQLSAHHRIDWKGSRSEVTRSEPDRSEIVYQQRFDPISGEALAPAWFSISNEGAVRTFSDLRENAYEGNLNYQMSFGSPRRPHGIRIGGLAREMNRDSRNTAYSIAASLPSEVRVQDPEDIFDGSYTQPGDQAFRMIPLSQGGSYTAEDRLLAGYLMMDYHLTDRLQIIGGARVERSEVTVEATSTVGENVVTDPEYTDVLPSLTLQYELTDRQNLRFAASQTLSRPEHRELANLQYREVLGGDNVLGNPELKRALIQNLDLRWEFYPSPTEALSVAVFAKRFENPIERVYLATSGTRVVSFANARRAENFGVELEGRKRLGFLGGGMDALTIFSNLLLMSSEIEIGSDASSQTNDQRAMVGQSPYAVNAGLTWTDPNRRGSATLLYNVSGRRIASAAEAPLPDIYEEARQLVDFSLRVDLTDAVSAKVDAKNLLDAPYELVQGDVVREFYRSGRSFGFGLTWRP